MQAQLGTLNQEEALLEAFSLIVKTTLSLKLDSSALVRVSARAMRGMMLTVSASWARVSRSSRDSPRP